MVRLALPLVGTQPRCGYCFDLKTDGCEQVLFSGLRWGTGQFLGLQVLQALVAEGHRCTHQAVCGASSPRDTPRWAWGHSGPPSSADMLWYLLQWQRRWGCGQARWPCCSGARGPALGLLSGGSLPFSGPWGSWAAHAAAVLGEWSSAA